MKKILALILTLGLLVSLAACTKVYNIKVDDPVKITVEKNGGGMSVTLTDQKTVKNITGAVEKIPLQSAKETDKAWKYCITWLDAEDQVITSITLAGSKICWEGKTYAVGIGVDLSVLTDMLEKIPGLNK